MQPRIINCVGKKVHDYVFVKELGKGAFGMVFSARNTKTQEIVAIKCIPRFKLSEHNGIVGKLLNSEVDVLQEVNSPHVVKLVNYLESSNQCYIVLEFCNSGDFEQLWISRNRRIPENEVIDYMKQILAGMQALHEKNVLHRDLKLANILIHNETLKIADLGFCKKLDTKDSQETLSLGSLGNMAPEVVEQKPYGMAADMFSIGSIFYQLLFGQFPFTNVNAKAFLADISQNQPDFNKHNIRISEELKQLIGSMLIKDPNRRLKWSDLYQHKLMQNKNNRELVLLPLSINQLAAGQIDSEKFKKFYGVKESQIEPQIENENQRQQNKRIVIQEVDQSQFEQSPEVTENWAKIQELDIQADREVTQVVQKYLKSRNQIVYLARTLNEMNGIKHENISQGLMPTIIISKKICQLIQRIVKSIFENENIYQTRYLNKVYENKYFQQFRQVLLDEQLFYEDMLKFHLETGRNNEAQLVQYIQREWLIELKKDQLSPEFNQYYSEVLSNYFFVLNETKLKEKEIREQELILNLQIHLVDSLLYEKLLDQNEYDVGKQFDEYNRMSMAQKEQIFRQKQQQLLC